jgi:hypothetical protein
MGRGVIALLVRTACGRAGTVSGSSSTEGQLRAGGTAGAPSSGWQANRFELTRTEGSVTVVLPEPTALHEEELLGSIDGSFSRAFHSRHGARGSS